jgi:hypothetical protein
MQHCVVDLVQWFGNSVDEHREMTPREPSSHGVFVCPPTAEVNPPWREYRGGNSPEGSATWLRDE